MTIRATANQVVQVGLEGAGAPGVKVAATRRLASLAIAPKVEAETTAFRPKGIKYPTVQAANKVWASAEVSGQPTYDEIIVPLSSALTLPVVTNIMDGVTPTPAFKYVFSPKSSGADAPTTWTVESGEANGELFTHGLFTDFDLDVSRGEVTLGGTMVGQRLATGQALTAGLEVPELVPILPGQFSVYIADDPADLGTGAGTDKRLTRVVSAHPQVGGRYNAAWFLNAADASFSTYVEAGEPDYTVDFLAEADADGLAFLDSLETGATKFLRVEAIGPVLASMADFPGLTADETYRLTWDLAVKVTDPGDFSDEDGVYAVGPTLTVVHDGGWGKASEVTVVCASTTLAAI